MVTYARRRRAPTIRYAMVDPNKIFGMVGRCGGGYNTIWEDWSEEGRIARENIMREFEEGMNKICGHYDRLEKSLLKEGFRNPVVITSGYPLTRRENLLPPEMRGTDQLLIAEGSTGGSRLWIAQKYNIPVPCIINDRNHNFENAPLIRNVNEALQYYTDKPTLVIDRGWIIKEQVDSSVAVHLDEKWRNNDVVTLERAPMWYKIMKKYGYDAKFTDKQKEQYGIE